MVIGNKINVFSAYLDTISNDHLGRLVELVLFPENDLFDSFSAFINKFNKVYDTDLNLYLASQVVITEASKRYYENYKKENEEREAKEDAEVMKDLRN